MYITYKYRIQTNHLLKSQNNPNMSYRQTDGRYIHVYTFPSTETSTETTTETSTETSTEISEIYDMVNTHTSLPEKTVNNYIKKRVEEYMVYLKHIDDMISDKLPFCKGTSSQIQLYNQIVSKELTTKFMNAKIADLCE